MDPSVHDRGPVTRGPAGAAPPRRPGSVRRTTTIDMRWVDGWGSALVLEGRGRDLRTASDGSSRALAESTMRVDVAPDRVITRIDTEPWLVGTVELLGTRASGGFRTRLSEALEARGVPGSSDPVQLLLDDVPGATLISGFAFAQWHPIEELLDAGRSEGAVRRPMTGICTGFQAGSRGLAPDGTSRWTHRTREVEPLEATHDVLAWRELQQISALSMRRARRIDVWVEGSEGRVDAMFQDSSTRSQGGRVAVHEYTLDARADLATMTLTAVEPTPHVLPYAECPLAVLNVGTLVGTPLAELRVVVLERLQGVAGCTHLNDALRALADVPALLGQLAGSVEQ
ncbi:hypothetical protein BH11ACT8_BH11ACT8_06020 [soil metagenome]